MTTEEKANEQKPQKARMVNRGDASEAVYGLGMIGAWIYYLTHATTFWIGALGLLKGIFWPAILVYEALKFLAL